MPFVKLDTGIVDSSLWSEPAQTCKCWITLLAMADAEGFVRSTAPGIARRANLGLSDTEKALEMFEASDPHSRSLNDEGRRIKRVDGGYQIINYGKYRERDYTAAERMRRKRERDRVTRNGCNKTVTLRKQKQKQKQIKNKEASNKSMPPFNVEDWLTELEKDPTYKGLNVRAEFGKCRNWCLVRGLTLSKRRFVNWINRAEKPISGNGATKVSYKRNYMPPAREPTAEEIATARAIAKRESEAFKQKMRGGDSMSDRDTKPEQPSPTPPPGK